MRSIGPDAGSAIYVPSFSPVLGGYYSNNALNYENAYGRWWGNEANIGARRYRLNYDVSNLSTNSESRQAGLYIRCVQAP